MSTKIKWGILGLGKIATIFAEDLVQSKTASLYGVASRNLDKAQQFKDTFKATTHYDNYEALAKDPNIDVIYVATPHAFHVEHAMLCLKHGKGVLCEKPIGLDQQEVGALIKEAQQRKLFLMEGIWTRFIPAIQKVIELLNAKRIGEITSIRADFGFKATVDFNDRLYAKALGGGALLDIGIYPIYLSLLTLGIPIDIKAMARMAPTGVDSSCAMLFRYDTDATAVLEATLEADTPIEAFIYGTQGSIHLHHRFYQPEQITITQNGIQETLEVPLLGNGYFHEIEEVNACIAQGKTESTLLPLQRSLDLSRIIDRVKSEIGLSYTS